jgi:hypothetical protein
MLELGSVAEHSWKAPNSRFSVFLCDLAALREHTAAKMRKDRKENSFSFDGAGSEYEKRK